MFFNLFKSDKLNAPVDVSVLKTDMHTHLIPGIDDGVKSIEESMSLIKKQFELGYKKIIITPHIMHDTYKNTPEIINRGLDKLKEALDKENIPIEIEAAAEYLVDDGFRDIFEKGQLLTFGNKYLLVELSYYNMNSNFFQLAFELNIEGYNVILAHPERYLYLSDNFNMFEDIKSRGIYFQLNILSLSGYYSPKIKKTAEKLIDLGLYDFAGSDLHNMDYYNNFYKSLFSKHLEKLVLSNKLKNKYL